jgi:preprotein translocase subunit YajC
LVEDDAMLISPAYAQAAGGGGGADFSFLIMMVLLFAVFYFLLIRPQQKKMKTHKAMVGALKRGDKVVTQGGIYGTVTKVVSDAELQVEIADGVAPSRRSCPSPSRPRQGAARRPTTTRRPGTPRPAAA